jgi:cytochrome c oxidase subunit 4
MDVDAPTTAEVEVVHDDPDAHTHGHHAEAGHDGAHGAHDAVSDNKYIVIAAILAVITAAEVAASYIDLGAVFIPLLLFMMAVKFFIVVSFFMHLRFDNRIFTWFFYSGLFLALAVYIAALATFRFFDG